MRERVIRDSVHGDIYINDDVILELIDTSEFQRLRRIAQLAGAQFAYPGATHTRFSHSLGVYYVIGEFLKNPDLDKHTTPKEKLLVKIAGLLHDLGHGPFSHTFEKITHKSHEQYSIELITNPKGTIAQILKKYHINPKDVAAIIEGTYKNEFVSLLVSSQLDADRLDYLMRDSYYAGVNYASIDISFLVRNLRIIDNKIAYLSKTIYAIESYLLGRYYMFKQVYNHKISLGFDLLLVKWFTRLKDLIANGFNFNSDRLTYFFTDLVRKVDLPVQKYLELDDFTMYELFKLAKAEGDEILQQLSERLLTRKIFKTTTSDKMSKKDIIKNLKANNLDPNYFFAEEIPKQITIYKDGKIDGKDETIYFFDKYKLEPLSKLTIFEKSMVAINNKKNKKIYFFANN